MVRYYTITGGLLIEAADVGKVELLAEKLQAEVPELPDSTYMTRPAMRPNTLVWGIEESSSAEETVIASEGCHPGSQLVR